MRTIGSCSLLLAAILAGCGGGGGGSAAPPPPPPPPNNPPVAQAGSGQTVVEETTVFLDGAGSTDSDGFITAFRWTQTSGPLVFINNAGQVQASFTAPVVSNNTVLEFQLLVTDDDNATATQTVAITARPALFFDLGGTITVPAGTAVDSDVNDANASFTPNDTPALAQAIPNPVTVGGYVNEPGTGEPGPSFGPGDTSDYYRVNLIAGETITLIVADPNIGDPDLYLWDATGTNIMDSSLNVGAVESLVVPSPSGEYLIEAFAFGGASNYVLIIGQTQIAGASGGFRLSDEFVPGDVIMHYAPSLAPSTQRTVPRPFRSDLGLRQKGGAPDRAMLMALAEQSYPAAILHTRAGDSNAVVRAAALANEQQRRKFETLMVIKALNRDPSVEYAQPNYIVRAMAVPNDPHYPLQWHYPLINLPAAWDLTTGDPSVTVAVVDTGVLLSHPDMQGQLVAGYDFVSDPQNAADGDGIDPNPDDPGDGSGQQPSSFHGTHVAGTIAAASNNGTGVAGVAWNARIMPLRVLGVAGGSTYDILQSVRYAAGLSNDSGQAASPPVDVMNLSLGGQGSCSQAEQATFDLARQAGVVVVVAAGNESQDAAFSSPANCDNVITVSAVDIDGNLAPYSNFGSILFGSTIDVAAPGGDSSRDRNGDGYPDGVLSTAGDDSSTPIVFTYPFFQGTSMASPHMAGVVALMKSVNPLLTPSQIDQMLDDGELTDDIGDPDLYGNGLINARKAVFAALNAAGTPPNDDPRLSVTPRSLNFGTSLALSEFTVRNTGGGSIQAMAPSSNESWLTVVPVSISAENLGTYVVTVDRTGLATGVYSDTITVQSNVNTVDVSVIMQVSAAFDADAGFLYILLISNATGLSVQQIETTASGGLYPPFEFVAVPEGSYELIAGTDSDNDFLICDPGEACGSYLTVDQPQDILLDQNLTGVDFSVSHVVAIPSQSLGVETEPRLEFRRMVRPTQKQAGR